MIDWFKFSLLLLYILLVITLVISIALSSKVRTFLAKIHKSPSDEASWLRYALSLVLIIGLGIAIHNAIYKEVIDPVVVWLVSVAIAGKVTASSINKDK